MFAAMDLLHRDDDLIGRVRSHGLRRPACPVLAHVDMPTRWILDHVNRGDHATGYCREWVAHTIALCRALGCPSLDAMLAQVAWSREGVRPGKLRATRLRPRDGSPDAPSGPPRRPSGTMNRPARDLLARRAHAAGGLEALRTRIAGYRSKTGLGPAIKTTWGAKDSRSGWNSLAREMLAEEADWRDGVRPERRDIAYPAWLEWSRSEWRRTGEPRIRSADDEIGRYLRRRSAAIDSLLESTLPELT